MEGIKVFLLIHATTDYERSEIERLIFVAFIQRPSFTITGRQSNQLHTPSLLEEEGFFHVSQPTKDEQKHYRRGSERPNRLKHCNCRSEDGQFESRHEHFMLTKSCSMLE
ncbi:hypothetical protein TNCT_297451 [Trichonephila clavata]|uniref:Uncharacterized protein n=1 Tax=Trichonephila clavata TaxID=2740835 RepID=A0A8X6GNF9_TRICU|nr:hypothetical protein TNCT_297451 [Trichonephila clavata]